jgi:hypothetical protein
MSSHGKMHRAQDREPSTRARHYKQDVESLIERHTAAHWEECGGRLSEGRWLPYLKGAAKHYVTLTHL